MLNLIRCEIWKYKRTKAIPLMTCMAVIFPLFLVVRSTSSVPPIEDLVELHSFFDNRVFGGNLMYSVMLIVPSLVGTIGAILFFTERDCDTFKNLRVIPVTHKQLIFAKVAVLYLWNILYSVLSCLFVCLFSAILQPAMVYDVLFKIALSILAGVLNTTMALPAVVLVLYCNQGYLLSVLLAFSYSILNWLLMVLASHTTFVARFVPLVCSVAWPGELLEWRRMTLLGQTYVPEVGIEAELQVALILVVAFFVSIFLILRRYRKSAH